MTGRPLAGMHVAVVGAGLAGLAAALECADLGARVTVLERRRRLGGLTWSFDHNGIQVDNGQHVFLACCDSYTRFLDRLGAAGDVEGPLPLDVPVVAPACRPGGRPVTGRLRRRDLPVPLHLAGALLAWPHLGAKERLLLGRVLRALRRLDLDDPALDRVTFSEWLSAHGQTPSAVAGLWDLITVPTVNLPSAEASLASAAMVFRTGLLSRRDAADIGWSRVPLGRLHGERAAAALARAGASVRTGVRVGALRADPLGGWEASTPAGPVAADAVVVAVPHEEAARVVPAGTSPTQRRWADLGSSAVVDVHLVFDRRVTAWKVMAGHRSPIQWVFDRSEQSGVAPGRQYLAVSYSAADGLVGEPPDALVGSTRAALAELLPAAATAGLVDSVVTKERRATFRAAPGTAPLRPAPATAHPGLALAGAWTATGWPATMEGAVRSGWAAAAAIASAALPSSTNDKEVA